MATKGRTLQSRRNSGAARSAFSNREPQGRAPFEQGGPGMGQGPRGDFSRGSGRMEQRRGSDDLMGMFGQQSRPEAPRENFRQGSGRMEQRHGSDDRMGMFSQQNRPEPPRQRGSESILGDSLMESLQPQRNRYTRSSSSGSSLLGTLVSAGLTMAPILYHMKDKDLTYHPETWVDEDNNEHEAGYYDEEGQVHSEEEVKKEEGTYETIYQCAYCGTQMKLTWKEGEQPSCPNCGAPLSEAVPAQKEEESAAKKAAAAASQSRTTYHEEDSTGRTISSSSLSSGSGCLGMTLMLLAGLVLSLIAIF